MTNVEPTSELHTAKVQRAPRPVTTPDTDLFTAMPPAMALHEVILLLLGVSVGALAAVIMLPTWLPGLSASLFGEAPKAYWQLARSSAMIAYALLWCAMVFGLLMSNRMARVWPGGPLAFDLHQHTSLLGLAFALFHALMLLGDHYIATTPAQLFTPFAYSGHAPFWVGLGQVAFYGMALIGMSFYVKDRLGRRVWQWLHLLGYVTFLLALVHGIMSGTDSGNLWVQVIYWISGGSILFLSVYRVLVRHF
ncbi:ferric reductase-like transmembrane domain-containing protein [Candidatus Viridilinea mediisalina]|uniref:Uncharacterized protein n=1 Tax=Candidatus Viridilinea mediisalina TaxID=2024553 RepID=A0A2A6RG66_9CHLR|nr:ferric reductase-like transmembrane domain-containing protein [Candidatus Viridilinea mediisalina]PDW02012.1 hypothetical protein CJ255_16210 [Candidatus Viridilinea mediisalina]